MKESEQKYKITNVSPDKKTSAKDGTQRYSPDRSVSSGVVRRSETAITPASIKDRKYERVTTGVDRVFLILVLTLLAIGSVMMFSASFVYAANETGDSLYYIKRHLAFVAIGFLFMLFTYLWPYTAYKKYAEVIFGIGCIFLVAVLVIGVAEGSAVRWIRIGSLFTFQPSDFMKPAIVVLLAKYFDKKDNLKENSKFDKYIGPIHITKSFVYDAAIPFIVIGIACGLVMLEHHLSGTLIIGFLGIMVMIAGGGSVKWIGIFGGVAASALGVLLWFGNGYQSGRIKIWLNPEAFPRDGGWQTIQGLYAIGSGGLLGVGLGNSRLKYGYTSMPHNDFIFSIVCEELGFVGAVAIMCIFALLVWRGMVIAMHAPDKFSSLLALGITGQVAIQVLLNIGVVTNTLPNTGISLPFFSYGGTAMVILMAEMGVMLKISKHSYQKK